MSHQEFQLERMMRKAGVSQSDCYQCGKCTAGCPMADAMDLKPRGVMRCAQMGALTDILKSDTIWLCTGCHTCVERCPHDVDVPAVMEEARYLAAALGHERRGTAIFNEVFLFNLRLFGKSHEMILAGLYNARSLSFLQDVPYLPHMLRNKLIGIKPHQVKNSAAINRMVKRALMWEEGGSDR